MMAYKTGWMKKIIDGVSTKVFAFAHAKTVYTDYENKKTLSDKLSEIDTEIGNKANKTEIPTELPACGYVGGAAKASASYKLNTSHAYLIIGTGHAPSTSIDSLSCGEYIYYDNSKWNRMQIFASSFPASAMGITGNTLIVGYNSQKEASSCDRHILLRVK